MSQKRKARNWHKNLRVKTHDLVRFENAYFLNISGRNSSPENGPDWLYLGEVERFGNFASNNGLNLTDITNWQNVLGINDFNGDDYIEKPDTTGTTTDFPFVVGLNDVGEATKLPAGDLGKNLYNSDGTILGTRNINMNNQIVNVTNVPDKSADSTFNQLFATNPSGQWVKANGKNIFKNLPSLMSEAEKTTWKTEMNGGWTTNSMSISDIFPPILKLQNQNSYISVKGANLNLNPANFSVSICDVTSTALNPIVLAVIPNNQVTLISPTDFAFYYNFNALGAREYKILLQNGVASYLSTYTFLLKTTVNNIDLGAILWNTKVLNDVSTTNMQAGGSGISFKPDAAVAVLADDPQTLFKAKTAQPMFNAGDDFYLEFNVNFTNIKGNNSSVFAFGLSSSSDYQTLINDLTSFLSMTLISNQFVTNVTGGSGTGTYSQNVKIVLIKRGTYLLKQSYFNMFGSAFQQSTALISDTSDFYFAGIFQNMDVSNKTFNIAINSAYKF